MPCGTLPRVRPLFSIAPGGACHASFVAKRAVRSYRTVSPLPSVSPKRRARAVCFLWRYPLGCPSRALPGTVVLWSPDFPRTKLPPHAAIRPSAQGAFRRLGRLGQRQSARQDPAQAPDQWHHTAPQSPDESAGEMLRAAPQTAPRHHNRKRPTHAA